MCGLHNTGLAIAPLPARKGLWEANDETQWRAENDGVLSGKWQVSIGLATSGDLVELEAGATCGTATRDSRGFLEPTPLVKKTVKWDEWCSEMDGLGGLVMLAAALA